MWHSACSAPDVDALLRDVQVHATHAPWLLDTEKVTVQLDVLHRGLREHPLPRGGKAGRALKSKGDQDGLSSDVEGTVKGSSDSTRPDEAEK